MTGDNNDFAVYNPAHVSDISDSSALQINGDGIRPAQSSGLLDKEYLEHARQAQNIGSFAQTQIFLKKVQHPNKRDDGCVAAAEVASNLGSFGWAAKFLEMVRDRSKRNDGFIAAARRASNLGSFTWAKKLLNEVD